MRSPYLLLSLVPFAAACVSPGSEPCASALSASAASASAFCATYTKTTNTATTGLPAFAASCSNSPKKLSSACSCLQPAATTLKTSTTTKAAATTTKAATTTTKAAATTTKAATTSTKAAASTTTSKAATTTAKITPAPAGCTATAYAQIAGVVSTCTNIVLQDIAAPASSTILLTKLKQGSTVTFAGKTTFGTTLDNDFDPIVVSGTDVTITGAPGHVIDGNGPVYWDGEGSNNKDNPKPDHFFVLKNMVRGTVTNLNIKNWPVHCFSVTGAEGMFMSDIHLDNTDGNAPNSKSGGKPAAHNSDGFDFSSSNDVILQNTYVNNQDDCVAVTSGDNVTISGMTCIGGHGLSIGSVGGKSNNVVTNISFLDSTITDSENGVRIKTNSGTTGTVDHITYRNIQLSGITKYGLDVQQDYLNGGPTGQPTNGVKISNLIFDRVTGTATSSAYNYYILCGDGSCTNFQFTGVSITGGGKGGSCNFPTSTCLVSS